MGPVFLPFIFAQGNNPKATFQFVTMCEPNGCGTTADTISDVAALTSTTQGGNAGTTINFVSDNNTEQGALWCDENRVLSCIPVTILTNTQTSLLLTEDANGNATVSLPLPPNHCGDGTVVGSHCLRLTFVSDGTTEGSEGTTNTVPEFGVSTIAVAAVAFVAIALYRTRKISLSPNRL
jgi:hypothetical protein